MYTNIQSFFFGKHESTFTNNKDSIKIGRQETCVTSVQREKKSYTTIWKYKSTVNSPQKWSVKAVANNQMCDHIVRKININK